MVTQRTLADVLIEAGFEPEAALRASEMIEQDLSDLARQSEVNLRFDQMDERFIAQGRAIEARFAAQDRLIDERFAAQERLIDERFAAQERLIDERLAAQERVIDARFDGVDKQFDGVNKQFDGVNKRMDDYQRNTDRRFNILTWVIGLLVAAMATGFGVLLTWVWDLLSRVD